MHIFISTGEVSGDVHGALLAAALKARVPELRLTGLGGDRMAAAGVELLGNTVTIGSIGVFEALPYLIPTFLLQRRVKKLLRQQPPDLVVLIDYMMPNIGMGAFARHTLGVPVIYYIAPQEWVWSFDDKNTQAIAGFTDEILAIFPQEAQYYRDRGAKVHFVGHPLIEQMDCVPDRATARRELGLAADDLVVSLVPASRRQEVRHVLPVLLQVSQIIQRHYPQVRFLLPLSLEHYRAAIEQKLAEHGLTATLILGRSHLVLRASDVVLAKSGTVNLETAVLGTPQVVCYRVSRLTAWVAKHILKTQLPFIAPPNLVAKRAIVPEYLQDGADPAVMAQAAMALLDPQGPARLRMLADYGELRRLLGETGALNRACDRILEQLALKPH
jgi:lipid-A-disaccharide synthase